MKISIESTEEGFRIIIDLNSKQGLQFISELQTLFKMEEEEGQGSSRNGDDLPFSERRGRA